MKIIRKNLLLAALAASAFGPLYAQELNDRFNQSLKVEASPTNPFKKAGSDDLPPAPPLGGGDFQGALPLELMIGTNDINEAPKLIGMVNGAPFIFYQGRFISGQEAQSLYSEAQVTKLVKERRERDAKLQQFVESQKKNTNTGNTSARSTRAARAK